MSTPGIAMLPRRSCHSPILSMLLSFTTLDMIVLEKTPFGNVTCIHVIVIDENQSTDRNIQSRKETMLHRFR